MNECSYVWDVFSLFWILLKFNVVNRDQTNQANTISDVFYDDDDDDEGTMIMLKRGTL